jgi:phosphoglycerate dehydrogenase-like enzyme
MSTVSAIRPEATHVWIPAGTEDRHRALLPEGVPIHVVPSDGMPERLGPGQFVVAGYGQGRQILGDLLRRLDDVRVVQAMSAGVEDLIGQIPSGAVLCDGAGVHDIPVAEWAVMAILAMYRRLPQHVLDQQAARWMHPGFTAEGDLEGAHVLIVGYGSIGRALEARLGPFKVNIVRVSRHARAGVSSVEELPTLLPQADVVVILLPLTPETERFVDARFLSLMRPGSLLVNPSRGRVVDTAALMEALSRHHIRAAIDVTDPEPLPDGHELWTMGDVLITPHVAGSVRRLYDRGWALVARQLRKYLKGEPLDNVVTEGY